MKKIGSFILIQALFLGMISINNIHTAAAENKIVVEKDTVFDEFDTIQEAIDSVNDRESAVIRVPAGIYDEAVSITNTKNTLNRTIILKGAQAGNSAVVNGNQRNVGESVLTNGIEINGLHDDASIIIDGFTLHHKGINIQGWGNVIDTTGDLRIVNNVITDIENGSVSAIHVNTNAAAEFISTFEAADNYIENIGEADYAANGIYLTITAAHMKVTDNVIRAVNHSCINFASAVIQSDATIIGNTIADWNKDGVKGVGAGGSEGDGIYITKTNTLATVPIHVHQNSFTRNETLNGNKGYAARCAYNKGKIDLSENYWGTPFPLRVISGGTYANVTLSSLCDENMAVKTQAIADISFSTGDLYQSGKYASRKLNAKVTMMDKTMSEPAVVYTTDTPKLITFETKDDGTYYAARKAGEAQITAVIIDPLSAEEYRVDSTFSVKNIEMSDCILTPGQSVQMNYQIMPETEEIPAFYKTEWISADETVAVVDENGLVTSTGKIGKTDIEVTISSFGTVYYHASATITIKAPNTAPVIHAQNKVLTLQDRFDPLQDVSAQDDEDGDLTANITVIKNDVDVNKAGDYEVIYSVTDSEGTTVEKTIIVTVKERETVQAVITAKVNDTENTVAEKQYLKDFEMNVEVLKELNTLVNELKATDRFQGYQCIGFFLDKEGETALRLGYLFSEDTMIYMLWEPMAEHPDDKPTEPEKPTEPDQPNQPDEPQVPIEPDQPDQPSDFDRPNESLKPDKPTVPEKPDTPNEPNPSDPELPNDSKTPSQTIKPISPETIIKPQKPTVSEVIPNQNNVNQSDSDIRFDQHSGVSTGDNSMFEVYISLICVSGILIFALRNKIKFNMFQ